MRPGRTQSGTNLNRYEIFAAVYMRQGQNAAGLVDLHETGTTSKTAHLGAV